MRDVYTPAGRDGRTVLRDGRHISYRTFGDSSGHPVLALHGTPGSRLKFAVCDASARDLGLRIIAPDRWGYGDTHMHPRPSLAAFADDMRALADAVGAERFAVLGISGGGPYAAAVAACLGTRVTALAEVAPVGPIRGEPDRGLSRFHRFCFGPLAASPGAVRLVFGGLRRVLHISPRLGMALASARVARADRRTLGVAGVTERLAATFAEGLRPGALGPACDLSLFGRRWSVPLANATAPARLWIGTDDRNVPVSAALRLAERLPRCVVERLEGEGHFWVALNYSVVLAWIARMAKGRHDSPSPAP